MRPLTTLLLLLLCLRGSGNLLAQTDAERKAVRAVLDAYLDAFARKEIDDVLATVAKKAPDRETIENTSRRFLMTASDISFLERRLSAWKKTDEGLRVRLRFERHWRDKESKKDLKGSLTLDVHLIKEGNDWKIHRFTDSGLEFARDLMYAATKQERHAILKEEKEFLDNSLLNTFYLTGLDFAEHGQFDKAERLLEVAGEIAEVADTDAARARVALFGGMLKMHRTEGRASLLDFKAACVLFRKVGDVYWEGLAAQEMAAVYLMLGEYPEALAAVREAAILIEKGLKDKKEKESLQILALSSASDLMGRIRLCMGDYQGAREAAERSLRFALKAETRYFEVRARRLLGASLSGLGMHAEGLRQVQSALKLIQDTENPNEIAQVWNDLGVLYLSLERYDEARQALEKARDLFLAIRQPTFVARARSNLGLVYLGNEDRVKALEEFEAALKQFSLSEDRTGMLLVLNNIGIVVEDLNLLDHAEKVLTEARARARQWKMKHIEAMATINLGKVLQKRKQLVAAMKLYEEALTLARESGNAATLWRCHNRIGQLQAADRVWDKAAASFEDAIAIIEKERENASETSLKRDLFESRLGPYHRLALCRYKLKQTERAFTVAEQAKSRTLVDLLEASPITIDRTMTPAERASERKAVETVRLAEARWREIGKREGDDAERTNRTAVTKARNELEILRRDLYLAHAELEEQRAAFKPSSLDDLKRGLFEKEPGLVVLSYLVGDEQTLLFVLTKKDDKLQLTVHEIEAGQVDLSKRVGRFRHRCSSPRLDPAEMGKELYQLLLGKAAKKLEGKSHLVILPDGPLHLLPFQALMDNDGKYLIERLPLSYAPSATALLKMTRLASEHRKVADPGVKMLALGRPKLPPETAALGDLEHSEAEANAVTRRMGGEPRLGERASKDGLRNEIEKATYVHIACHGVLEQASPLYSYLALSDGTLYAHELMGLQMKARLVVLSACRSGEGQVVRGEGLLGMAWALFVARVPSCLLTQWEIGDRSSVDFMSAFYQALGEGKATKAEALRRAQLTLLRQEKYRHPDYWAPFVLLGDWGK